MEMTPPTVSGRAKRIYCKKAVWNQIEDKECQYEARGNEYKCYSGFQNLKHVS